MEICNTSCFEPNVQEAVNFNNLSIVWNIKILLIIFSQERKVQSFVEISEIAWEEFEIVSLRHWAQIPACSATLCNNAALCNTFSIHSVITFCNNLPHFVIKFLNAICNKLWLIL